MLSRRGLILGAAGLLVARGAYAALQATPAQSSGPFYPHIKPADIDMDLTILEGARDRALGQVIEVSGRVLSIKGHPLAGALVEIWQADSNGRYNHPGDGKKALRDRNFQGYGAVRTGRQGEYRFRTVRPRFYETGFGARTPHIHFRVVAGNSLELVTQMYFPGERMNESDAIYRSLAGDVARNAVTARAQDNDPSRLLFDVVLA